MKVNACYLFVFLVFFLGCSGSHEGAPEVGNEIGSINSKVSYLDDPGRLGSIPVDYIPLHKPIEIRDDSLIVSYYFIPLETTDNVLIKLSMFPQMVFLTDSRIVIVDRALQKIFIFDRIGKAICTLFKLGKGPEDYLSLGSVSFDYDTNLIYVYSISRRTVNLYDLEGKYVRTERTGDEMIGGVVRLFYMDHAVVDRGLFTNEDIGFKQFSFYDRKLYRHLGSHFTIPSKYRGDGYLMDLMLDVSEGELFALSVFENGIFRMEPDKVEKVYDFTIPEKYKLTREKMDSQEGTRARGNVVRQASPTLDRIKDFFITRDWVFFKCDLMLNVLYSRRSRMVRAFDLVKFSYDSDQTLSIMLQPVAKDGDYLVEIIPPETYSALTGIPLDSESNPVLMFYKFKKF